MSSQNPSVCATSKHRLISATSVESFLPAVVSSVLTAGHANRGRLRTFLKVGGGIRMSESQKGSTLAGVGGIAFGVLTVIGIQVGGTPGGNYVEADVASYVGSGHFPTVIATGYLAVIGVLGLICLLAYLRAAIA